MMDPEMMRVAQEQMRRMPPAALAAMQQQLMSNPSLLRFATEGIKTLTPDDLRRAGEQMSRTSAEEVLGMSRRLAAASPEELAATMKNAQAEQQRASSYAAVSGARALKDQGNALFKARPPRRRRRQVRARRRQPAERPVVGVAVAAGGVRRQPDGVPPQDREARRVRGARLRGARPRPGQRQGALPERAGVQGAREDEAAVADLRRAHELSPEEDAIADALRDAEEKLGAPRGLVIEEIVEEEEEAQGSEILPTSGATSSSTSGHSVPSPSPSPSAAAAAEMMNSMGDPAMGKMVASVVQGMDPETVSIIGKQFGVDLSRDDAARLQDAMKKLSPENLEKVMGWVNRARRAAEAARKAKELLLGSRRGWLVLAIVVLVLAFVLHHLLGFIGA
ncbi:hypothetical protein OsJ_14896 [Oryza sativa Japonica Group]|uniref:Uncharacterized protein n=1 Tax=Oryza sativa subsp. japonica TaxID=39947 RepID=A3AU37_ORYSJ|nr:hypothetical protein OsJ_14896 [Oryza sativa Japonica Group]